MDPQTIGIGDGCPVDPPDPVVPTQGPIEASANFDICEGTYTLADLKQQAIAAGLTENCDGQPISVATPVHELEIVMHSRLGDLVCCNGQDVFTSDSEAKITNSANSCRYLEGPNSFASYSTQIGDELQDLQSIELTPGSAAAVKLSFGWK